MDRIILNIVDKKTEFQKRVVIETNMVLQSCDFITIGEEIMFDKDTDFLTFGMDITSGTRHLAVVTGEFLPLPPNELIEEIKKSLADKFEVVEDTDVQLWVKEKAA